MRNKGGGTEEHRGVEVRNKGGGSEEHAHPGKPYFMRVSGLAKNPILSKTVQDCLRTEAAAACLDDSGLASKIEREARNLQTGRTERPSAARSFILYEAEGASRRGWSLRHKGWGGSLRHKPHPRALILCGSQDLRKIQYYTNRRQRAPKQREAKLLYVL